ncbi:kinesin [Trypanosoma rangeli SC58]|uniref:Kinesin-like protein n=1 Tax=Trypanosoma rangeli SC58 TaxID=429131 RepID=A0A061J9L1_TRYRA|nr:kinesin [Trypanosoma rangeli SC58]
MSIDVHVRIRPNVPNGVWSSAETVLYSTQSPNTRYVYNKVHHIGTSNQTIFQGIEALVHAGFDGKNVTVMAYGQTGSGKTYSMNGSKVDPGIVPRTAKLLLDLRMNYPGTQIVIYFTEIYNESVKDLLEPQRGELGLHDAPDGGVYFDKKSLPIESIEDFVKLQNVAERNRKYGVTNLNDHSSRSHMILTFEIHRAYRQVSTINLVDLAGSESASRANTDGLSLREGGFINKSLLTLGNVVDAIVEKKPYVPYRDAKLTRILRSCSWWVWYVRLFVAAINPSHSKLDVPKPFYERLTVRTFTT